MLSRVFADLHIHSIYSRATSVSMTIKEIARFARIKGLSLVGTGDFTHPRWLKTLKEELIEEPETSLYKPIDNSYISVRFMVTGEVCTVFEFENHVKKIHHLLLTPSIETAEQINDRLSRYGDLSSDGRPTLNMSAPELVEEVLEAAPGSMVIPAHAWTPWFSLFGAFSGFDRIEDCYQDMTRHISALETGLSSDPPMNWRLSALDRFTLVSNSDSHSPWPWRIGREANAFEMEELTYDGVLNAIKEKQPDHFRFTIETNPAYGKYHWTGHRRCEINLSPEEAIKMNNICPVCRRKLTKGVEQRVEELADRPVGYRPEGKPGYMRLLPLSEIIQTLLQVSYPSAEHVWEVYNTLIGRFGDEYTVLISAPMEEMVEVVDPKIADAVIHVREERVHVVPGYDGVYGRIEFGVDETELKRERRTLDDFLK